MINERVSKIFFLVLLLAFLLLTFFIIKPFFSAIILGVVLAGAFSPVYKWLLKILKNRSLTAGIMIILVPIIIIIPLFFITTKLVGEAGKAYRALGNEDVLIQITTALDANFGISIDLTNIIKEILITIQEKLIQIAPDVISSIAEVLLGLFVMFFIMYYTFKGGDDLLEEIKDLIPLKKKYKVKLWNEMELVINGVLYGQILTAIIQGGLGGLLLFVFGVPNSLFWGFIMIILAFLPVVGTPMIFVPAGIYMIATGHPLSGILILIIGGVVVMNIDNVIKPKLISARSKVHPVVALIGVLGGLVMFGIVGLILGPIIIALFLTLLRFYAQDFKEVITGQE